MKKVNNLSNAIEKSQILGKFLPLLCAFLCFPYAHAQNSGQHQRLTGQIETYLTSQLVSNDPNETTTVSVTPIDKRIKIPQCPSGYHFFVSDEALRQSYISVRVSCPNSSWYLFANAKTAKTRKIVVTYGMISPGTILTAQNLKIADVDVKRLRHTAYTEMSSLIGARIKHRVRDGQPIQANMLCFVCKGDRVTIRASMSGMQIKTAGIANQDGVVGDAIQVMNANSKKVIVAQVSSTQEVVVNL